MYDRENAKSRIADLLFNVALPKKSETRVVDLLVIEVRCRRRPIRVNKSTSSFEEFIPQSVFVRREGGGYGFEE